MKKILLSTLILIISILNCYAQTIDPLESSEQCPGVNVTFTVTITAQSVQSVQPKALNVNPVVVQQPFNISVNGSIITFNFIGKFSDYNNKQTFTVYYTNTSGLSATKDFTFPKIKSLLTANSCSQVQPSPANITAPRCQTSDFNISFSNVQYGNPFESPQICYGTVSNYEYLLPAGWSLGGTSSNGSTWIAGGNNVTVTSDLSTGDGMAIRIRPTNIACASGLVAGQESSVSISRPAPTLTITATQDYICSGCASFTINGMPSGATVQWSLSNTTDASISGCSTCSTVSICRNTSANTIITLTATVTHCTFTYPPVTHDISLGTPSPNPINVDLIDPAVGRIQVDVDPALPGVLSYNWYKNGVLQTAHGSFAQIPITRDVCDIYYSISAKAINSCGTSSLVYKDVYVPPCGNSFMISPNPASNSITISVSQNKTVSTTNNTFDEIRIYDFQGTLKKYQQYKMVNQATINVSDLINGTYFIEITNGTYKERKQLIIQK